MRNKINKLYDSGFYDKQKDGSYQSAKIILGILFKAIKVRSIVDVGCGVGTWLRAAKELGCKECLGIEGDWVANKVIIKNGIIIKTQDLENKLQIKKKYDLAISMEVAEHLTPKRADSFVRDLCRCSDIVLFSAAVPGQMGVNHLNEKPISFWAKLFLKQNFIPVDLIRPLIYGTLNIKIWYRRNSILYISTRRLERTILKTRNQLFNHLDIMPPNSIVSTLKKLLFYFNLLRHFLLQSLKRRLPIFQLNGYFKDPSKRPDNHRQHENKSGKKKAI